MDKSETAAVLSLLKMNYPAHFKTLSSSDGTMLLDFWNKELEKYDYKTVCNAVSTVIKRSEFCPAISHVIEQIKIDTKSNTTINNVKCDICNGTGLIDYARNIDYEGKVGVKELTYGCRCSCNSSSTAIPSYIEIFGFNPLPREKPTEKVNVIEIIAGLKRMAKGFKTL